MAEFYTYFLSSLPMLHFASRMPFSYRKFLELSAGLVTEGDRILLEELPGLCITCTAESKNGTLKAILDFERLLRNELVRARAPRFHFDPIKYTHIDQGIDLGISHIAQIAYRNPAIIEGEKALDAARWEHLEELSLGHYFDLAAVIIYARKLLFLVRWENIRSTQARELLSGYLS